MLEAILFLVPIVLYAVGCRACDMLGGRGSGADSRSEPSDDFEALSRLDIASDGKLDGRL